MPSPRCPHGVRRTRCSTCNGTDAVCPTHAYELLSCKNCISPEKPGRRGCWKKCPLHKYRCKQCAECNARLEQTYPKSTPGPVVHSFYSLEVYLCKNHARMVRRGCGDCQRKERRFKFTGAIGIPLCTSHKDECSKCPRCAYSAQ